MKYTLALLSLLLSIPATPALARTAPAPRAVRLPADAAMHPAAGVEWWYYVGHLSDAAGHTYGFETTFFKFSGLQRFFPASPVNTAFRSDVAITDEAAGRFHHLIRYTPAQPTRAFAATDRLRLHSRTLDVTTVGALAYHLQGSASDGSVDLTVASQRPPMLVHGGYLGWGAGYTYYYSLTDMTARGTLTIGSRHIPVHGTAWMDHQWGDMENSSVHGWDWMALQLDDHTAISLVNERTTSTAYPFRQWAQALFADNRQVFVPSNVQLTPLGHWRSPLTKITYPAGWRVRIPSLQLDVVVRPTVADQEMADRISVDGYRDSYWEGSCTITGTHAGRHVTGKAYTELTGYGSPPPATSLQ